MWFKEEKFPTHIHDQYSKEETNKREWVCLTANIDYLKVKFQLKLSIKLDLSPYDLENHYA